MNTPILLLIFNRPELSLRVLNAIRAAQPKRLFIASDGPRASKEGESSLCEETRALIDSQIDWECEVQRLIRTENLGCQEAVSSAIDWFFTQVEEGIILEDDTLPTESFFHFAEALLLRYRDDARVMHISGNNHQHGRIRGDGSYYASRFAHSWGWATWRRAWQRYNITMPEFPEKWDEIAEGCHLSQDLKEWWKLALGNVRSGITNTWDFQWHYTLMKHQGISLIPNKNLVKNIGVGAAATHMKKHDVASSIHSSGLYDFTPPSSLEICHEADQFDFDHAVTNQKVPLRSLGEFLSAWKFDRKQREGFTS